MLIWVIDAEQWPRANLRAELIERGYDAVGFVDIPSALQDLSRKPALIVLELRGQELTPQLLDSLTGMGVPVILLGGGRELNDPVLAGFKWGKVLRRPILLGDVADFVEGMAPLHPEKQRKV